MRLCQRLVGLPVSITDGNLVITGNKVPLKTYARATSGTSGRRLWYFRILLVARWITSVILLVALVLY